VSRREIVYSRKSCILVHLSYYFRFSCGVATQYITLFHRPNNKMGGIKTHRGVSRSHSDATLSTGAEAVVSRRPDGWPSKHHTHTHTQTESSVVTHLPSSVRRQKSYRSRTRQPADQTRPDQTRPDRPDSYRPRLISACLQSGAGRSTTKLSIVGG